MKQLTQDELYTIGLGTDVSIDRDGEIENVKVVGVDVKLDASLKRRTGTLTFFNLETKIIKKFPLDIVKKDGTFAKGFKISK